MDLAENEGIKSILIKFIPQLAQLVNIKFIFFQEEIVYKFEEQELLKSKLIDRFRSTRYVKYVRDGTLATDIVSDVRYGGRHRAVYNI